MALEGNPLRGLWGSFQAAVNDPELRAQPGGISSYVWASIRNDFLSRGESIPTGSFQAVNELLSLAGQQRRAGQELAKSIADYNRTGLDQAITSGAWAWDINSRPLNQQPLGPNGIVRFTADMVVEGKLVPMRLSHRFGTNWPQSVEQLLSTLAEAAGAFADEYDTQFTGVISDLSMTGW